MSTTEMSALIKLAGELGLTGDEIRNFVKAQQDLQRDLRAAEKEEKEREHTRQIELSKIQQELSKMQQEQKEKDHKIQQEQKDKDHKRQLELEQKHTEQQK